MKRELQRILSGIAILGAVAWGMPCAGELTIVDASITLTGQNWRHLVDPGDPEPYPEYTYRAENLLIFTEGEQGEEDPGLNVRVTYTWTYDGAILVAGGTPPGDGLSGANGDDFVTICFAPGLDDDITVTVTVSVTSDRGRATAIDSMEVVAAKVDLNGWEPSSVSGLLVLVPQGSEEEPGVFLEYGVTEVVIEDLHIDEGQFHLTFDGTRIALNGDTTGDIAIDCADPSVSFPQCFLVTEPEAVGITGVPAAAPAAVAAPVPVQLSHTGRTQTDRVTLVPVKVQIKRDGTPLPGETAVCVGEKVALTAEVRGGGALTDKKWTILGKVLKDYRIEEEETNDSRTVKDELRNSDLEGQDAISFHWYVGGTHTVTFSVVALGQTWSAQAAFSVAEPTSHSLEAVLQYDVGVFSIGDTWQLRHGADIGSITVSGSGSAPAGFSGVFEMWNVVKGTKAYRWNRMINEWDERDHYGHPRIDWRATARKQDSPHDTVDAPGWPWGHWYRMDRFRTWLMFRPSGAEARWVPVRVFEWGWFGDALRGSTTPYDWTKLNGSRGNPEPTSPVSSIPTSLVPEWKSDIEKVKDNWQDVPLDSPPVDPPQKPLPVPW